MRIFFFFFLLLFLFNFDCYAAKTAGTKTVDFDVCVEAAISTKDAMKSLGYSSDVIVNTKVLYMVKIYSDDAPTIITCSKPDRKMVVTEGDKY